MDARLISGVARPLKTLTFLISKNGFNQTPVAVF